jgi:ATP-dependent Clp protease ATP-binding subunit ClpA
MYETFTDRARKVMRLAHQEAQILSRDHIDTEHILLGLIKEASGVAAFVLKHFGFNLLEVRLEVARVVECDTDEPRTGKLPQTPLVKKVIEHAIEEARNLKHNYVGTEHLLLGLLRQQEGAAVEVLLKQGHRLGDIRQAVLSVLGHDTPPPKMQGSYGTFTGDARKAMQLANEEAQRLKHEYIGTEHILLGIIRQGSGIGVAILKKLGIKPEDVRQQIERIVQFGVGEFSAARLRQTPKAKKVIEYAIEEAHQLNRSEVDSGHLLLGLAKETDGVAAQVLLAFGVSLELIHQAFQGCTRNPPDEPSVSDLPVEIQQTVRELEARIEELNREKEVAVADADFEKAAELRDQADRLRRRRENLIRKKGGT